MVRGRASIARYRRTRRDRRRLREIGVTNRGDGSVRDIPGGSVDVDMRSRR
jgi:hypothetical protein